MRVYLLIFTVLYSSFLHSQTAMTKAEIRDFVYKVTYDGKQFKTLQNDFVQTKKMDFLNKDIVTSGKMAFQAPNLLSWSYTHPYQYSIIFKNNKIYINDQGKKSTADARSKMFEKINMLMMGSASGTLFTDREFSIAYLKTGSHNIARFTPKSAQLLKYIRQVEIQFPADKTTASRVTMLEASGDTTTIDFKNTKVNAPVPASVFAH